MRRARSTRSGNLRRARLRTGSALRRRNQSTHAQDGAFGGVAGRTTGAVRADVGEAAASRPSRTCIASPGSCATWQHAGALDTQAGVAPGDVATLLAGMSELATALENVDLVGISCWTSLRYLGAVAVARKSRRRPQRAGDRRGRSPPDGDIALGLRRRRTPVRCRRLRRWRARVSQALCEEGGGPHQGPRRSSAARTRSNPTRIDWERSPSHRAGSGARRVAVAVADAVQVRVLRGAAARDRLERLAVEDALAILGAHTTRTERHLLRRSAVQRSEPKVDRSVARWDPGSDSSKHVLVRDPRRSDDACTPRSSARAGLKVTRARSGSDHGAPRMVKSPSPANYLRKARDRARELHRAVPRHVCPVQLPASASTTRETQDFV